ncbi:hypothetical protein DPMN_086586 [Dreissena polymorpha]|uniref:Sulfhydryl light chain n=2 Tax=Dreissena polymorpha TaxID=45954 RepID=A0A9D4KQQ3_DREPO|nr:hypothetical protein DPMN_086586 [Dreissena polymorpha]
MDSFHWITNSKKVKEFRVRFDIFDRHKSGIIKVSELISVLQDMGMKISREMIDQMMASIGKLGEDEIHFDEFMMMAARKEVCEDDYGDLKEAFSEFDNGKGFIAERDLRLVMTTMGEKLSDDEVDEMIEEASVENGMIHIDDFISVLLR